VPVLFEIDGMKYLGWQLKGTLPFLFNCRYEDLWIPPAPSIISTPISQSISNWQSPPIKAQYNSNLWASSVSSLQSKKEDLVVSPNGQYPTINSALKVAKDGDRIIVRTGLYKESIILNKMVELIADGFPIIENSDYCITMKTDYAVIKGFTLQCRATFEDKKVGVYIPQGKLVLEYCDITCDSLSCIQINNKDTQAIIRHCKIHDGKDVGIFILDQATAQIEDCEIVGNDYAGIEVKTGGNPTIRHCKITNNSYTIYSYENGRGTVENCDLRGNRNGA